MKTLRFKKFISGFLLSVSLFFAGSALINQASAVPPPGYSIEAVGNSIPGVLDVNIMRPGELRSCDIRFFYEFVGEIDKWIDNTIREVRVHFFSPNDDEEDQSGIEYTVATFFVQ